MPLPKKPVTFDSLQGRIKRPGQPAVIPGQKVGRPVQSPGGQPKPSAMDAKRDAILGNPGRKRRG